MASLFVFSTGKDMVLQSGMLNLQKNKFKNPHFFQKKQEMLSVTANAISQSKIRGNS